MLVIGNGESRKNVQVNKLAGIKVGCNAIIRDYIVDHLICVDQRMVDEAIGYNTKIYTRADWISKYNAFENITTVPKLIKQGTERWDEPFHWGSGPYAVLLSATLCNDRTVSLLGFDLHSATTTVNNIYKGTPNYDPIDKNPVDPRYWIHQISKVFEWFPKIHFKIYQTEHWTLPESWIKHNVSLDNLGNLIYNK